MNKLIKVFSILAATFLLLCTNAFSWTDDPFRVDNNWISDGSWRVTSLTEEQRNDSNFQNMGRQGLISVVTIHREKGKWLFAGMQSAYITTENAYFKNIMKKLKLFVDVFEELIPDPNEHIIVDGWIEYEIISIYVESRFNDKKYNEELAKKLNERRKALFKDCKSGVGNYPSHGIWSRPFMPNNCRCFEMEVE